VAFSFAVFDVAANLRISNFEDPEEYRSRY